MDITYLISPTAIKYLTNISDNLSEKYITTAIRETQQVDLCQVLGDNLLVSIENMVIDGSIQDDENRAYKTLLDNYISYFLAYGTVVKLIPIVAVKIDNAGAVQNGDEKVENISLKDMFELSGFYMQKADYYKARLQKYLREHYKDYPQLDCSSEIHSAYSSPFYLGGIRHKRVPRGHNHSSGTSTPLKKYTISYYVDNVLFTTKSYVQGTPIKYVEAPQKDGYNFNVWIYEKNSFWENLPDFMPNHNITTYAHYLPVEGEQKYYTLRYRVADWREDGEITFDNMAYIPEPFEWLQVVEREYDPNTREGWAKLTHPSLTADSEIRLQKFPGHDALFMLDLSEFNNCYMTDRMFAENTTLREFYPPKGLVGAEGYDFYNCQYLSTINFATADGYKEYEPYSYPMTGAFCNCVSLTAILADNQYNMYSDNGNLYNNSHELMAARYGEVTIKEGCTAIKSEALKARGLTALTIPASVRKIELYAISENMELTDVYFGGTMDEWARIEKDDVNTIFQDTNVTVIHCGDGVCPVDYNGGGEQTEYKVDIYLEWDYYTTQWYNVGDKIELPEPPVREGYVFVNWNWSNGTDWIDEQQYMPNYNLQVHATYAEAKPDYHNVNYYVDGELVHSESYKEGETIEAPTAEKEGHTFLGWEGLPSVMPSHDIDTHAIFEINSYKITYVAGDWSEDVTYEYGATVNEKTAPVKEGYSFLYWDELPTTMPAKDITVSAVYERNEYKITYMIDGVPYNEARYYFEDEIQPYVPKVDEGYIFNGWDNEPTVMPAYDVVVTGSITEVKQAYTLTYWNGNEGFKGDEVLKQISLVEGEAIDYFQPPLKEGFTHRHWAYHKDEGVIGNAETEMPNMPGHDLDVWTYYTFNSYNVYYTLYDENGDVYLEDYVTYRYTDTINPYHPDIPEGYTFSWDNEPATMPAHDVHVTGSLTKVEPAEKPYEQQYLTLESLEDNNTFTISNSKIQMSSDNGATWKSTTESVTVNTGDKVLCKSTATPDSNNGLGTISATGAFNVYGNALSLVHGDDFKDYAGLGGKQNIFKRLFNGSSVVDASSLILPTDTTNSCYEIMFRDCKSLVAAPELPCVGLSERCYSGMFRACISLTTAPELPSPHMKNKCYNFMFYECSGLTSMPELPATTLADYCYASMFYSCKKLVGTPVLPATTLAKYCYQGMFIYCNKISTPVLPATTLADYCYYEMFKGCNITTPPELPATTLAEGCYKGMFDSCSISDLSNFTLPATTLAKYCYQDMFKSNGNLTNSPILPALSLAPYCYNGMFNYIGKLTEVTMLATDVSASKCLDNFIFSTNTKSGILYKHPDMSAETLQPYIPSTWTIENYVA